MSHGWPHSTRAPAIWGGTRTNQGVPPNSNCSPHYQQINNLASRIGHAEPTIGGEGMYYTIRLFTALIVIWIGGASHCFGQASAMNGEISGTVTDPAGGSIANAVVRITNIGTGFRQTGKTGDSGVYRFSLLPLGAYDLEVQASGFATVKRSGIEVNAGATVTVNLSM